MTPGLSSVATRRGGSLACRPTENSSMSSPTLLAGPSVAAGQQLRARTQPPTATHSPQPTAGLLQPLLSVQCLQHWRWPSPGASWPSNGCRPHLHTTQLVGRYESVAELPNRSPFSGAALARARSRHLHASELKAFKALPGLWNYEGHGIESHLLGAWHGNRCARATSRQLAQNLGAGFRLSQKRQWSNKANTNSGTTVPTCP